MDARSRDRARGGRTASPGGLRRPGATTVLWLHRTGHLLTSVLAGWGVYHLVLEEVDDDGRLAWAFLPIWVLCAYVLLPRLNRVLTGIYVPGYFIGRARTADGLLGDPINVAVIGTPARLSAAMLGAGWTAADPLTVATGWRIVRASLLRRSYPAAPVSPLFAFGRKQSLAFEREVAGSPARRHHVRFWTCPPEWRLPGGVVVDLVGAASYDRRVGLSLFTLQVTHKIAENTDGERDLVVSALRSQGAPVEVLRHFSTGYHARNGGGDAIETDGDLPVVDVRPGPLPEHPGSVPDGR
ncbi:LssY C-terminal domain-containing protein [Kocuria nitroreducens]|uniref:LssY C-terminal domain-containing protein n=1 Tax=Kocuria nitroreducens TaxID=3058914 RepID=UPI0036DB674A